MLKQFVVISLAVSLLSGCGEDSANSIGSVQWRFNYGDWTDNTETAKDDLRDCANQPSSGQYAGNEENPYPAISKVRVFIEDPDGQVPNSDKEFDCALGYGSSKVDILSMTRQVYDITVEAKDAAGNVLYRHKELDVDLSVVAAHDYELKAVTSETTFFPTYDGGVNCPQGVSQLRYSFFTDEARRADDGQATYLQVATQPCTSGTSNTIIARGIPVDPQMGSNNTYNPTMYTLKLEALDSDGAVTHCGWDNVSRAYRPGDNKKGISSGNIDLKPGTC